MKEIGKGNRFERDMKGKGLTYQRREEAGKRREKRIRKGRRLEKVKSDKDREGKGRVG